MWDVPGPGTGPVSPALTGRFFTTELQGSPALGLNWGWMERLKVDEQGKGKSPPTPICSFVKGQEGKPRLPECKSSSAGDFSPIIFHQSSPDIVHLSLAVFFVFFLFPLLILFYFFSDFFLLLKCHSSILTGLTIFNLFLVSIPIYSVKNCHIEDNP